MSPGFYQAGKYAYGLKDKSEAAAVSLAFIWTADGSIEGYEPLVGRRSRSHRL
jgi:hypothetical protein